MAEDKCPICFLLCRGVRRLGRRDASAYDCPRCGYFEITRTAWVNVGSPRSEYGHNEMTRARANLSGWVRENPGVCLDSRICEELANLRTPSFHEKAEKLMRSLERQTEYAGQIIPLMGEDGMVWAWCLNDKELKETGDFLLASGRLRLADTEAARLQGFNGSLDKVVITPAGWAYLETMREPNPGSRQAFVALSFAPELREVEAAITGAIRDAGYEAHVERGREHLERVDDEIVRQIRRSRFVAADFTGQRPNVYYEAGFARGLGLPVFWSCRKDEVDRDQVHFDVRQYNHIAWEITEELRAELSRRIEANLGQGEAAGVKRKGTRA